MIWEAKIMYLTKKQKWLIVTVMVCIALIMAFYGTNGDIGFFGGNLFSGGGTEDGGYYPSESPLPTYFSGGDRSLPSETPDYTPSPYPFSPEPTHTRPPDTQQLFLDASYIPEKSREGAYIVYIQLTGVADVAFTVYAQYGSNPETALFSEVLDETGYYSTMGTMDVSGTWLFWAETDLYMSNIKSLEVG